MDLSNITTPWEPPAGTLDSFSHIAQYLVLALTVVVNFLLILTLSVRDRAMNFLDKLMLNSVACNVLLVMLSIPTNLFLEHATVYPFGYVVCKLIDPLSTHFINTCVVTYICIAVERLMVCSKRHSVALFAYSDQVHRQGADLFAGRRVWRREDETEHMYPKDQSL